MIKCISHIYKREDKEYRYYYIDCPKGILYGNDDKILKFLIEIDSEGHKEFQQLLSNPTDNRLALLIAIYLDWCEDLNREGLVDIKKIEQGDAIKLLTNKFKDESYSLECLDSQRKESSLDIWFQSLATEVSCRSDLVELVNSLRVNHLYLN